MSEQRPGGAAVSRAVLTALRAAAVLIVATGLNDIIANAVPTYEPLYLYLGAIAVATLLDGLVIGAVTASIATFFYALLFGPRPPVLETSVGLPAMTGALVVVVFAAIGAIFRRFRRPRRDSVPAPEEDDARSGDTPLLEASIVTPAEEIVTALEEMRADLRGTLAELSTARERERALELELRASRATASDDADRIVAGANRAVDALSARVQQVEEHSRARETRLEQAWNEARDALAARVRALETDLERERKRVDTGNAETARLAEAEAAAERAEAEVVAARLEVSELTHYRNTARLEISELTNDRNTARREIAELHASLDAARRELGEYAASAAASEARVAQLESHADRDRISHRALIDTLKAERDGIQSTSMSLAHRVAELESALEVAADEGNDDVIAARLESSQLAQRVVELQEQLVATLAERDAFRDAAATAQTDFDAKLQSIAAHLAEDHEQDLGNAIMEKEAVRAEARGMNLRLGQLQQKIEEERTKWLAQKDALTEKLRVAEERASRAVEDTTRVMTDARVSWQAELERLRARVAQLEGQTVTPAPPPPIHLAAPIQMPPPAELVEVPYRPRIVVVHPDMELREAARLSLMRAGYEVTTAADGLEGLRVAIAMRPDVVIADSQMPKMDGRELCQLLKSQEKTAHIKIVLLTRNADERVDGADEVLKKPVPFETLRAALNALLAR